MHGILNFLGVLAVVQSCLPQIFAATLISKQQNVWNVGGGKTLNQISLTETS